MNKHHPRLKTETSEENIFNKIWTKFIIIANFVQIRTFSQVSLDNKTSYFISGLL